MSIYAQAVELHAVQRAAAEKAAAERAARVAAFGRRWGPLLAHAQLADALNLSKRDGRGYAAFVAHVRGGLKPQTDALGAETCHACEGALWVTESFVCEACWEKTSDDAGAEVMRAAPRNAGVSDQ